MCLADSELSNILWTDLITNYTAYFCEQAPLVPARPKSSPRSLQPSAPSDSKRSSAESDSERRSSQDGDISEYEGEYYGNGEIEEYQEETQEYNNAALEASGEVTPGETYEDNEYTAEGAAEYEQRPESVTNHEEPYQTDYSWEYQEPASNGEYHDGYLPGANYLDEAKPDSETREDTNEAHEDTNEAQEASPEAAQPSEAQRGARGGRGRVRGVARGGRGAPLGRAGQPFNPLPGRGQRARGARARGAGGPGRGAQAPNSVESESVPPPTSETTPEVFPEASTTGPTLTVNGSTGRGGITARGGLRGRGVTLPIRGAPRGALRRVRARGRGRGETQRTTSDGDIRQGTQPPPRGGSNLARFGGRGQPPQLAEVEKVQKVLAETYTRHRY